MYNSQSHSLYILPVNIQGDITVFECLMSVDTNHWLLHMHACARVYVCTHTCIHVDVQKTHVLISCTDSLMFSDPSDNLILPLI